MKLSEFLTQVRALGPREIELILIYMLGHSPEAMADALSIAAGPRPVPDRSWAGSGYPLEPGQYA